MKVLLAIDGSEHSHAALDEIAFRKWPAGTEIEILTVIHSRWPLAGDPFFTMAAAHMESVQDQQREAPGLLSDAAERIREGAPGVSVTTRMVEGVPHELIVQEANGWGADLIVLGSHGYGPVKRMFLGSVAAAVASEAPCAVEIIRMDRPPVTIRRARKRNPAGRARTAVRPALKQRRPPAGNRMESDLCQCRRETSVHPQ